jgi:predicted transcriptional regulator
MLIALSFIFVPDNDTSAASITTVSIFIEDWSKIIDLESTNSTIFRGNVSVISTAPEPVLVQLKASFADFQSNWEADFKPETWFFDQSGKVHVEVTINVPTYTIADHYSVRIGGVWKYESDETWDDDEFYQDVRVTIKQYYGISFSLDDFMQPYLELDKSSELYYSFFMKNEGNGKDTLTLELLNENELVERDWAINFNPFQKELSGFQEIQVNLSITPPQIDIPFETSMRFQLTSEYSNSFTDYLDLYIYSEPDRIIIVPGKNSLIILRSKGFNIDQLSPGQTKEFQIEARCYVRDSVFSLSPTIYSQIAGEIDHFDFEQMPYFRDANIDIDITPAKVNLEVGDSETFTVKMTGKNESSKSIRFIEIVMISAEGDDVVSNINSHEFFYITRGQQENRNFLMLSSFQIVAISTITILSIITGLVGGTEFGRYGFLLLFIPLYTKLHKDKVLDHFTRGRIYEYIRSHPGSHFSEIKRELKLTNGGLAYHLYTLEREELIRSYRSGKLKLFYTSEFGIPKEPGRQFSELEAIILQIIDENPGITQSEVGEMILNRNHRTVSHNIKELSREGYLRLEKEGRTNKCFIDFSEKKSSDDKSKKGAELTMDYRI